MPDSFGREISHLLSVRQTDPQDNTVAHHTYRIGHAFSTPPSRRLIYTDKLRLNRVFDESRNIGHIKLSHYIQPMMFNCSHTY